MCPPLLVFCHFFWFLDPLLLYPGDGPVQYIECCCSCSYSITGEEFLSRRLGIGKNGLTEWDLWVNVVALSCIALGMLTLAYIQLLRTKIYT